MTRKRMLVYWDYRRKDLLFVFHSLSKDIDFIFLFFREPAEDDCKELPFERIYWSSYASPYQLLDKIRPDKVIFSDFSNINTIALNIAAKNKNIVTLILDHGAKADVNYYKYLARKNKKDRSGATENNQTTAAVPGSRISTLKFYFSVLKPSNLLYAPSILQLFWRFYKYNTERALSATHFSLRKASQYLLFSEQNLAYWQQFDGVNEKEDITYIGNPYLDEFFNPPVNNEAGNYYLLIDEGIIDVSFEITVDQKNEFTLKLNEFCLSQNAALYIKLHPFDYERTDLVQHPNIKYIKTAKISELVQNARGCFGISSTLVIPLIPQKKILLFRIDNNPFQDELVKYSPSIFLDYINFKPLEIDFNKISFDEKLLKDFVFKFLYKDDGRSLQRIQQIFMS